MPVEFDYNQQKKIKCVIKECIRKTDKEICIFVRDVEGKIFETYLVRI